MTVDSVEAGNGGGQRFQAEEFDCAALDEGDLRTRVDQGGEREVGDIDVAKRKRCIGCANQRQSCWVRGRRSRRRGMFRLRYMLRLGFRGRGTEKIGLNSLYYFSQSSGQRLKRRIDGCCDRSSCRRKVSRRKQRG